MRQLIENFIDGAEVDFTEMLSLGLIKQDGEGYSLTVLGKSFCKN